MTAAPEAYAKRVEAAIAAALEELQEPLLSDNVAQHEAAGDWYRQGLVIMEGGRPVGADSDRVETLLTKAKAGDADADRQLLGAAAYLLRWVWRPGDPLAAFAAEALANSIPVDRDRVRQVRLAPRNLPIVMAVFPVVDEHGFRATRNAASHGDPNAAHSACSIVVEALTRLQPPAHMGEANVERLWKEGVRARRRRLSPRWPSGAHDSASAAPPRAGRSPRARPARCRSLGRSRARRP